MPINLELWEINLVLEALSELPYSRVCATIRGITEQVEKKTEGTDSAGLSKGGSYDF